MCDVHKLTKLTHTYISCYYKMIKECYMQIFVWRLIVYCHLFNICDFSGWLSGKILRRLFYWRSCWNSVHLKSLTLLVLIYNRSKTLGYTNMIKITYQYYKNLILFIILFVHKQYEYSFFVKKVLVSSKHWLQAESTNHRVCATLRLATCLDKIIMWCFLHLVKFWCY